MKKLILLISLLTLMTVSCTENKRAKTYGGSEEIELQKNHVLLGVTWKDSNMWLLTKDTTTNICYFNEKSSWGIWEGQITIK